MHLIRLFHIASGEDTDKKSSEEITQEIDSREQAKTQSAIRDIYLATKKILESADWKDEPVEFKGKKFIPAKKLLTLENKRNKLNLEEMQKIYNEVSSAYSYFLDQNTLEIDKELGDS